MVLRKDEIEAALHAEHQAISQGRLKEDNPLDLTDDFRIFCEACRRGDLKICQEQITTGVNINARDRFDYTPLILVSDSMLTS
jgi:ankyrin repeat/BTB/POZ domain-containing protein 1